MLLLCSAGFFQKGLFQQKKLRMDLDQDGHHLCQCLHASTYHIQPIKQTVDSNQPASDDNESILIMHFPYWIDSFKEQVGSVVELWDHMFQSCLWH